MGVDFYACHECGGTFPDCGHYVSCEHCGRHWCSDKCAKMVDAYYDYKTEVFSRIDPDAAPTEDTEDGEVCRVCTYCLGEEVDDASLLRYAIYRLHSDRRSLEHGYLEEKRSLKVFCVDGSKDNLLLGFGKRDYFIVNGGYKLKRRKGKYWLPDGKEAVCICDAPFPGHYNDVLNAVRADWWRYSRKLSEATVVPSTSED